MKGIKVFFQTDPNNPVEVYSQRELRAILEEATCELYMRDLDGGEIGSVDFHAFKEDPGAYVRGLAHHFETI